VPGPTQEASEPAGPADAGWLAGLAPLWLGDRAGVPDFASWGAFALADGDGQLLASAGDPQLVAFLRSSAKPFQACAFTRRGLPGLLGLGAVEVACACASHQGERRHVDAARRILAAAGLDESRLLCGTHAALDPELARAIARGEVEHGPIHNNCSGKHAAMLAACRREGWDLATYTEPDHPLQRENLATLATFAGLPTDAIPIGVDNCTVPTFALPLAATARAAARLVDPVGVPADLAAAGLEAAAAMTREPGLVGGLGRLDTALMEATRGRLVVKTGANGFYLAAQRPAAGRRGVGLALKLGGAESEPQKAPVVLAVLAAVGLLAPDEEAAVGPRFSGVQRHCRGEVVGSGRFVGAIRRE